MSTTHTPAELAFKGTGVPAQVAELAFTRRPAPQESADEVGIETLHALLRAARAHESNIKAARPRPLRRELPLSRPLPVLGSTAPIVR